MYQLIIENEKGLDVRPGYTPGNPQKHCSDGDSIYLNGKFENVLFRLAGIDAFEVRGMNIDSLMKSRFLYRLEKSLRSYLRPRITDESVEIHKNLGIAARYYLESILEEELTASFGREILDRYGRPLTYLSTRDSQESFNLRLIREGWAIPYFIYPNAGSPTEDGEWNYETITTVQDAALEARENNFGIWNHIHMTLIPMELRFLTRREPPSKYCADIQNDLLYPPQQYFKIPIENRLFFYPRDVFIAIEKGFKPTQGCDAWLHRVWRVLQGKEQKEK